MAVPSIAAAASGGKSAFVRATILRDAHAATRARMAPSSSWRHGNRYNAEVVGWVPEASYRVIFADCLRWAWRDARIAGEEAAFEASLPPIPAEIADRVRELREAAWYEPISSAGNERYSAMLAQARDLTDAARAAAIDRGFHAAH